MASLANPTLRSSWAIALALLGSICLTGSFAHAAEDCDDLSDQPINFMPLDFRQDVLLVLRDAGCAGCHAAGGQFPELSGESLTPLIPLLANQGVGTSLFFVEPFLPEQSYLFQKINCASPDFGERMPLAGFAMPLDEQALVFDWIYQGALGERPRGFWFRDIIFRNSAESMRF